MLSTGSEHGRPRLSQTPYTGQEAVRKIFEQFSQISNSISRFSLQLDSIQEAAKHISIEFHALAYQMRSARTLFGNDSGYHGRSGIHAHPSRSSGQGQSDEEYLRNYQFREFAKIQIRKDLAAQTGTKDPTLNNDELLQDYEEMLKRKAKLSEEFYRREKEAREKPGPDGMSKEQKEHLEYLEKKAKWSEKFKQDNQPEEDKKSKKDYQDFLRKKALWQEEFKKDNQPEQDKKAEKEYLEFLKKKAAWNEKFKKDNQPEQDKKSKEGYEEFLEKKAKWAQAFRDKQKAEYNTAPRGGKSQYTKDMEDYHETLQRKSQWYKDFQKTIDPVTNKTREETQNTESLKKYIAFLKLKSKAYTAFTAGRKKAAEKEEALLEKKEEEEEKKKPKLPERFQKYREDNQIHTFTKEEHGSYKYLNQYSKYLSAKEVEYLEHKKRMEAHREKEKKVHETKRGEIPLKRERKFSEYVGTDATDPDVVSAMGDAYKKPLAEYINFLTEKENAYFAHKEAMKKFKDKLEDADPRTKRRKEKEAKEKAEYQKQLKEAREKGLPDPKPPEDMKVDWRTEEINRLKKYYQEKLSLKMWFMGEDINLDAAGIKNRNKFWGKNKEFKKQRRENFEAKREGQEVPHPDADKNYESFLSQNQAKDLMGFADLQMAKSLTEKPFIMGDIETFGTQVAENPNNPKYAEEASVVQTALALKGKNEKGELIDLIPPLNLFIKAAQDAIPSTDAKLQNFNKKYYEKSGDRVSQEEASEKIKEWFEIVKEKFPDATVFSKGNFETRIADASNDPVKEALKEIYGSKSGNNIKDLDHVIYSLIQGQKAVMGSSPLQEKLTEIAKKIGDKESVEREEKSPTGKTKFSIEVLQAYLGDKSKAHDASTDIKIQSNMMARLNEEILKTLEKYSNPNTGSENIHVDLAEKLGALINSITSNEANKSIDLAGIFKEIFASKKDELKSLELGNPENTGENVKFTKKYNAEYKEKVQELLKGFSEALGINVFSLFDKVKITRAEAIEKDGVSFAGRVVSSGEGENQTQTMELAIPDTIFGDDPEGKARIIALLIEEGIIHGLGNKIPGLFSGMGKDTQENINKNLQDVTGVDSKKLKSGTKSGKYLNDLEERLAALVKALTGQDVKPLFGKNAINDGNKYALHLSKVIKKALAPALILGALATSFPALAQEEREPHSIQPEKSIPMRWAKRITPQTLNKEGKKQFDAQFKPEATSIPKPATPATPVNPLYSTTTFPEPFKAAPKKPQKTGENQYEYRNVSFNEKTFSDADTPFPWLRLEDVDAPEVAHPNHGKPYNQPGGQEAKKAALEWLKSKKQLVAKIKKNNEGMLQQDGNNKGRFLGDVIGDGESLIDFLVSEGHAQVNETEKNISLKGLEKEAASKKKGIWKLKNRINPGMWRKMSPNQQFQHLNMPVENSVENEPEEPTVSDKGPAVNILSFLKYLVLVITGGMAGLTLTGRKTRYMETGGLPAGKVNYPPGPRPFDAEPRKGDLIEAMVDPDEMIMNEGATEKNGPLLNRMNMGEKIDLPDDRYKSTGTFTVENPDTSSTSTTSSPPDSKKTLSPKFIKLILSRMGKTEEDLKDNDLILEDGNGSGTYAGKISKDELLTSLTAALEKEKENREKFEEASASYEKNANIKWYDPEVLKADKQQVDELENIHKQSQADSDNIVDVINLLEKLNLNSLVGVVNANSKEEALSKFNPETPIFTEKHIKLVKLLNKELEKQIALEKKELEANKKSLEVENKDIQVEKSSILMGSNFNRFMEEVPVSWGEALAETLLRISGAAYANNSEPGINSESKNSNNQKRKIFKDVSNFKFEAMDAEGNEIKDSVDAANTEEAQQKIRQMGYIVTKISEGQRIYLDEISNNEELEKIKHLGTTGQQQFAATAAGIGGGIGALIGGLGGGGIGMSIGGVLGTGLGAVLGGAIGNVLNYINNNASRKNKTNEISDDSLPDPDRKNRPIEPEHRALGGFPGGPKWPDVIPTWLNPKELIVPENMVSTVIQSVGMFGKGRRMASGGFPGSSGSFPATMRPSGGGGSSGDVFSVLTGKINDFIANTRFGAFISGIQSAANSLHNFQQSLQGMVANASPDTFATFTNSIKLLSGSVGVSLIPVFMRASAILQDWADDIMNGTGVIGRFIKILTNFVDSLGNGFVLKTAMFLGLMGAAIVPVISFLGLFVNGITAILRVIPLLVAAIQTAAIRSNPLSNMGASTAVGANGLTGAGSLAAGAASVGSGFVNRGNAGARVGELGKNFKSGLFGSSVLGGGILSGLIGGVTEGIENADLNISKGEKATRVGAQVIGGGGGAWGGAAAGAAIGSFIFPGIATAIGGALGGIIGGLGGSWAASKTSDAAFGNKYRNEKNTQDGSSAADTSKQKLAMSFQSVKAQSSFSSVEEAYKKIQVSALGDDPMTYELKKMNEVSLVNMLKELQKFNNREEKSEPVLK